MLQMIKKEQSIITQLSKRRKTNIAIVASLSRFDKVVAESSIASFVNLIKPSLNRLFIIAANTPTFKDDNISVVELVKYGDKEREFILLKLCHHLLTDLRLALTLFRLRKDVDVIVYYVAAKVYPLSELLGKLIGKKVVVFSFNPLSKAAKANQVGRSVIKDGTFPPALMGLWDRIVLGITDHIWVESKTSADFSNLGGLRNKVSICPTYYIDLRHFKIERPLEQRKNIVGFIGRLVEQKGVLNLVHATPLVLRHRKDLKFIIGGDGPLKSRIEREIKSYNLEEDFQLLGLVPHEIIPYWLNQMRLFVLPSYTEGLPRVVQEAMACGTVVLATPVGGVPDLIKDGETGFIMEDNSPECITKNIIKALNHPDLGKITKNARYLIESEYTYEATVKRFRKILASLCNEEEHSE